MKAYVDLSGTGIGARKQYDLLRRARPHIFTTSEHGATHVVYWQSFTRDFAKLEQRKRSRKKIICRVGGFHPENADATWRLLKAADGAIFVAEWLKRYLKIVKHDGKTWRLPPKRVVIRNGATWVGAKPSGTPYLLIRCAQIGSVQFKRGLNRAYSVWAMGEIWDRVRERYPNLELWLLGKYEQKTKDAYKLPGWKWLGYRGNARDYGRGAIALVHLVAGDYSPNSVAEAIGEGIPVLVPGVGGANELAGYGGRVVRFQRTDERNFPEAECAGHFYKVNLDSLFDAVCDVVENRAWWKLPVRDWWRKSVDAKAVAKKYEHFLRRV